MKEDEKNTAKRNKDLLLWGGIAGIVGTLCYTLVSILPLPNIPLYLTAMAWPVLSIIFAYSIYMYINTEKPTNASRLAFLFAGLGFTLVAVMLSVQLSVRWGIEEYIKENQEQAELLNLIKRSLRLVDHGIDVAWDIFIGTSLIFLGFALKAHDRFKLTWAIPSMVLGLWLMAFNVATFPWPPYTRGLFDVGPIIGIYIITLSGRMIFLSRKIRV